MWLQLDTSRIKKTIPVALMIFGVLNVAWGNAETLWQDIKHDHAIHYSGDTLIRLAGLMGVGGIMANTHVDEALRQHWQKHLRTHQTNDLAKPINYYAQLPQVRLMIPLYVGTMILAHQMPNHPFLHYVRNWGYHSIRTLLLGAPQQAIFNAALGAKRPEENCSKWHFHGESRGISGHAFYGAVPLLNAAQLSENIALKGIFYGLSILPGLARINDDKHYTSQALLGWGLAYLATSSVMQSKTQSKNDKLSFFAYPLHHGGMLALHWEF